MTTNTLNIKTMIQHFHKGAKGGGRLIATSVAVPLFGGQLAVGICRVHKNERRPSRVKGRALAENRAVHGLGFDAPVLDTSSIEDVIARRLFVVMDQAQYAAFVKNNPFRNYGCIYGATDDSLNLLEKTKLAQKKVAAKKKAKKASKKITKKTKKARKHDKK